VLRAAIGVAAAAVGGVLAVHGVEWPALALYGLLVAAAVAIPASAAVAVIIGYPAAAMAFVGDDRSWAGVFALVVLLHLVHVLAAYAAIIPIGSRVHPEALRAPAKRFATVQLCVLALGAVVILLPGGRTDAVVEIAGLACAIGLVLGVVLLMRRKG
jgi:glucan phosphoethanolaminetransferase (alkaline phosphatase superfamily)